MIDPVEKAVLNYHQRRDGFADAPDQTIPLAPQTAWAAPCDVDPQPGLELLMSTTAGLVYYRQQGGLFEGQRHTLISASQVFTNFDLPVLILLSTNKAGMNGLIPVISPQQVVLYHRNSTYEWSPGPPLALRVQHTRWSVSQEPWQDPWALGANPARQLWVSQAFRARREERLDHEPENESIRKLIQEMKATSKSHPPRMDRVDVNGDGRKDLVLWQSRGEMGLKTDVLIFLRGADEQLPERPTQVLRCRGFPIPIGSSFEQCPVHDLKGDGVCELVLLKLRSNLISARGLVDTFLSHGIDWALTVRTFHNGAFSRSPDASVRVTGVLPSEFLGGGSYLIEGDYNGDGGLDLLVRRSNERWNVFFSTADGRWFTAQPALTFDAPGQGYPTMTDLNSDGRSDIVWHDMAKRTLSIFMSPSGGAKRNGP